MGTLQVATSSAHITNVLLHVLGVHKRVLAHLHNVGRGEAHFHAGTTSQELPHIRCQKLSLLDMLESKDSLLSIVHPHAIHKLVVGYVLTTLDFDKSVD
jgi:hypothetical protein